MGNTGKIPAPRLHCNEESAFPSSPKWPRAAPPQLLARRNPPSRRRLKLPLRCRPRAPTSQLRPDKLRPRSPRRGSSRRGDGGLQERASSPKCNLNRPSSLPTARNLWLSRRKIRQRTAAGNPKARRTVKLKEFHPSYRTKSPFPSWTEKLWSCQREPRLSYHLRAGVVPRHQRSP